MTNELIQNSSFGLKFTPAVLEMERYEEMEEAVKFFSDKYSGLVFTAAEKNGASEARSELIALQNSLEAERKNVKREFNKPLQEFETKVKKLVDMIGEPLDDIRDGLKVIEEGERERRIEALYTTVKEMVSDTPVNFEDLEIPSNWTNKGNFTNKLKPTTKFEKEIQQAIDMKVKEKEHEALHRKLVTDYCESRNIEPSGWLQQLEYRSASEIMDDINHEEERRKRVKEAKEAAAVKAEEQRKQEELLKAKAEITVEPVLEPVIATEAVQEQPVKQVEQIISDVIEVTGTVEQLSNLNEFFKSSGIKVKRIEKELGLDDLPF